MRLIEARPVFGVGAGRWDWQGGVYVIAVLTMVVGAVLSVTQTDVSKGGRRDAGIPLIAQPVDDLEDLAAVHRVGAGC